MTTRRKITDAQLTVIRARLEAGEAITKLSRELGVQPRSLYKYLHVGTCGRPRDTDRAYWAQKLGLTYRQGLHLRGYHIAQLERCKSDEARRLILFRGWFSKC